MEIRACEAVDLQRCMLQTGSPYVSNHTELTKS